MLFTLLRGFADQALSRVREGGLVDVREERAPGPRPRCPAACPDFERVLGPAELTLIFEVPGATASNTAVYWDAEVQTFSVIVTRFGNGEHECDWYAELRLPAQYDGAKSRCVLKNGILRVRAPQQDTPGTTGLALLANFAERATLGAACWA